MRQLKVSVFSLFLLTSASAQVTLQPWVEVFGTVNGQQLGKYVTGITPSANLPYRAAVSKNGSTSFFRLNSPTDTSAQLTLPGENVLTGDLNGDGWTDVVTTKTIDGWDTVLVYWGTVTGIDITNPLKIPGEHQDDIFGARCVGDVNNDGKQDLLLSAFDYPHPLNKGKVYIYLNPIVTSIPDGAISGETAFFGMGVNCTIADLNNDGFNDLVIRGNNQSGPTPTRYDYVNVYWGVGNDTLDLSLGRQLRGYNLNSRGLACFDANGDGIADLLWINKDSAQIRADVWVHFGGVQFDSVLSLRLLNPGVANFGNNIIHAGDMNGDGFPDIAVSAFSATQTAGFVFVYGGGPTIDGIYDAAAGLSGSANFGWSVANVGDVSGDGLADIIVGAPEYDYPTQKGYWTILKGDSTIHVTDVKEHLARPSVFRLYQCYPNPFNPRTTIRYNLNQTAYVMLEVVNMVGQHVTTLVNREESPGDHEAVFDASGLASGVYLYCLTAKTKDGTIHTDTKKLTLIK